MPTRRQPSYGFSLLAPFALSQRGRRDLQGIPPRGALGTSNAELETLSAEESIFPPGSRWVLRVLDVSASITHVAGKTHVSPKLAFGVVLSFGHR